MVRNRLFDQANDAILCLSPSLYRNHILQFIQHTVHALLDLPLGISPHPSPRTSMLPSLAKSGIEARDADMIGTFISKQARCALVGATLMCSEP